MREPSGRTTIELEISPADECDRQRTVLRDRIQRWITRLTLWWLLGQVATLGLLGYSVVGAVEGIAWPFLATMVAWGLSIVAAGAAGLMAVWNSSLLPVSWRCVGCSPALIEILEATVLIANFA